MHELGNPLCPTLGCGYSYPYPGKQRESPRRWAWRRRARLRECRKELREGMFADWRAQSRAFLVPFFSFALISYALSLGQWINLRPLDAALLVGLLGACTLRVYLARREAQKRELQDVQRRISRRHKRWIASIEQSSNMEVVDSTPQPTPPSSLATPSGTLIPSTLSPMASSAWYPKSPPSEWGPHLPQPQ